MPRSVAGVGVRQMDISTAALKSDDISRQVPPVPPAAAGVSQGHLWRAREAIYGLADAPSASYHTLGVIFTRK